MNIESKSSAKQYQAPKLAIHGKVTELTAAGGTSAEENNLSKRPR